MKEGDALKKQIPIGISDFKKLMEGNYYYNKKQQSMIAVFI